MCTLKPCLTKCKYFIIGNKETENDLRICHLTRPRGYKTFSCSTQLRTKFQLLIKTKLPTKKEVSCFRFLRINHANNCWHCNIYDEENSKNAYKIEPNIWVSSVFLIICVHRLLHRPRIQVLQVHMRGQWSSLMCTKTQKQCQSLLLQFWQGVW